MTGKPLIVATLAKNGRESVRVALDEFRGHHLLDVRVVVPLAAHAATMTPTGKGISVNVAMIPSLRVALADAEAQAVALGWLPAGGG
ncbi:PC4/YdbC family ssDNA-binding protein [Phenylobacterium sp.]|uniref:PC4/YdbC family ssDNA-binding protein n=1 Tax=Phenylobacterium sp. TaxID=1871053 RepID=UPI003BAC36B9